MRALEDRLRPGRCRECGGDGAVGWVILIAKDEGRVMHGPNKVRDIEEVSTRCPPCGLVSPRSRVTIIASNDWDETQFLKWNPDVARNRNNSTSRFAFTMAVTAGPAAGWGNAQDDSNASQVWNELAQPREISFSVA